MFFWTLIKHFWQTLQKLLDRRLKYFCSVFFKKMFCRNYKSHQNNPMDTKNGFEDLAKKFSSKHRKIFAQCLKITEMVFFKHFLDFFDTTKTFLWTIRMQFSQHRRKMFARKLKVFSWMSKNIKKPFPSQNFFLPTQWSSAHLQRSFDYLIVKTLKKSRKISRSVSKKESFSFQTVLRIFFTTENLRLCT